MTEVTCAGGFNLSIALVDKKLVISNGDFTKP